MARRRFKTYRMMREEARERTGTLRPRRTPAGRGAFSPISIDAGAAQRGVHTRLLAAMAAATLACACAALAIFSDVDIFSLLAAATTGLASSAAAVSLILSARREELVHRLAHDLNHPQPLLEHHPDQHTDGSV
jgi:hypothetical protein